MTAVHRRLIFQCFGLVAATMAGARAHGADVVLPPASQRFAAVDVAEVPDLQRHVLPLLGRLGCNGRACHGSFQGQGGFRLSLFGYDFEADHQALTAGESPRVDRRDPAASLMLRKPTLADDHEGGKRFDLGGWQHRLLLRWIEAGATSLAADAPRFESLSVEPQEIVFNTPGETVQLKVTVRWSDGTLEDVTPLCRFRTNDESTAEVNEDGLVMMLAPGDTDVVAFYDNGVAPMQVLLPVSKQHGPNYPQVATSTRVDELVVDKLRKLGVVPSEVCTDAEFLRRVSLDLTGTLPAPDEVLAFLADTSTDKRRRKVDELLERPTYAAWWTTRLCDMTGNTDRTGPLGGEQNLNSAKARQWYQWLHRRVAENMPYDRMVEGITLAVSRKPGQNYDDYCREMSAYFRTEEPADFAARDDMPYFWSRRAFGKPEEAALGFAYSFLGISLQCAQCHKHPFDQWTKQDFDQFSEFFRGVRYGLTDRTAMAAMKDDLGIGKLDEDSGDYKRKFVAALAEGKIAPFKEVTVPPPPKAGQKPRPHPKLGRVITPKLLGDDEVSFAGYSDPRRPLMDWMRQEDNPYFARAIVNRVWAAYFHVGVIEPPDDHNLANPPSNPALLDYLAREFVARDYDLKWLHREIVNSETYQRSIRPNETNRRDERNFSRAVLRRLPAEVTCDAFIQATASKAVLRQMIEDPLPTRAIGLNNGVMGKTTAENYSVVLFGKPDREINCDCQRSNEPTLLQTIYRRNDPELLKLLDRPDGVLAERFPQAPRGSKSKPPAAPPFDADEAIRDAYLRTLSRLPDGRESAAARKYLGDATDARSGLRDLFWVLLNTNEFIVNH